jgi:hypothetical protein
VVKNAFLIDSDRAISILVFIEKLEYSGWECVFFQLFRQVLAEQIKSPLEKIMIRT